MIGDDGIDRSILAGARRMAPRGPCIPEDRLVAFYEGRLGDLDADEVREHLVTCPSCLEAASDARRFVAEMSDGRVLTPPRARRRILLAAAAVLAGIVVIVGGTRLAGRRAKLDPTTWIVTPAPYAPPGDLVWRGGQATPGSLDAATARYRDGDYAAAATDLAAYVSSHPEDSRARFYLGVARLLSGQPRGAAVDLEAALAFPDAPTSTAWYLALARLRANDVARARDDLLRIAVAGGEHGEEARALLRRLDGQERR